MTASYKTLLSEREIQGLDNEAALKLGAQLVKSIRLADHAYHTNDAPDLTDAEYDILKLNLNSLEEKIPYFFEQIGYSKSVGSTIAAGFEKVKHSVPMLSLNNGLQEKDIYSFEDSIRKFLGVNETNEIWFTAEPKIDGLSLSLRYENGVLVRAVTRGDGDFGENVTNNALTIKDIPQLLKTDIKVLEVRGEVYMGRSHFIKLNANQEKIGAKLFANPRNAAAGSLRQLNTKKTKDRNLSFFAYGWGELSELLAQDQFNSIQRLADFGFITNSFTRLCKSTSELLDQYNDIMLARPNLDYDIDGVVYKINNLDYQRRLGFRSTTPRWAIAHKFPAQIAITEILDIEIQVGRTGSLSPVARLKPINIGGVVVSNATLHNKDYIAGIDSKGSKIRDGVDIRVGDMVEVYRAGDVIPKVKNVVITKRKMSSQAYVFPDLCPVCKGVVLEALEDSTVRCTRGMSCSAQAIEKIKHFVSKKAFNIDGFGKKLVETFFLNDWVQYPSDIFSLESNYGPNSIVKLSDQEGWGPQSASKLFQSISKSRTVSLSRLIYSLGIRHVGEQASALLAKHYISWETFYSEVVKSQNRQSQGWFELELIDGMGEMTASSLVNYFSSEESSWVRSSLVPRIVIKDFSSTVNKISPFLNLTIVFTGSLEKTTRAEAKSKAEEYGAKVTSAVSQKTDILVIGRNAGSKVIKATDLGVRIMSEDEWLMTLESLV